MGLEVKFQNNEFETQLLDRFIFAVQGRAAELFVNGVEQPVTSEKAIAYLGISRDSFYRLVKKGAIKPHFFPDFSTPFFFRSEIFQTLKNSK